MIGGDATFLPLIKTTKPQNKNALHVARLPAGTEALPLECASISNLKRLMRVPKPNSGPVPMVIGVPDSSFEFDFLC